MAPIRYNGCFLLETMSRATTDAWGTYRLLSHKPECMGLKPDAQVPM
jgi:hypothetical protein